MNWMRLTRVLAIALVLCVLGTATSEAWATTGMTPGRAGSLPVSMDEWESLPPSLRMDWRVGAIALRRGVESPKSYAGGVYGKIGSATYFATTTDRIDDWDRLYWVMVKVLSEKYGCFIRWKQQDGAMTRFGCRDKRQIAMWRSRGEGWIQFHGRQYGADGRELVVRNRQVIATRAAH